MASATLPNIKPGKLFIGGKWVDSASGKTFTTINPATGETLTMLADAGDADVPPQLRQRAPHSLQDRGRKWAPPTAEKSSGKLAISSTSTSKKSARWKLSITASQFLNRATWICPWWRRSSAISPVGHKNYGRYRSRARAFSELHAARTDRSRRCNHSVEFSVASRVVENRSSFGRGKYGRSEARATNVTFRAAAGRNLSGSGTARWRAEHFYRLGAKFLAVRWSLIPAWINLRSPGPPSVGQEIARNAD